LSYASVPASPEIYVEINSLKNSHDFGE